MRLLLMILLPGLLLLGSALVLIWLPLPAPFPAALSGGRNLLAAVVSGGLGLTYLAGLAFFLASSVRRSSRTLDALMRARGLKADGQIGVGREYRGTAGGRPVVVRFFPAQWPRSSLLNVTVAAEVNCSAAVGVRKPLLDCGNCPPLDMGELAPEDSVVLAEDGEWMRTLMADESGWRAMNNLLADQDRYGHRELYFQPEQLWLRARPTGHVSQDQVGSWLDDLLVLAEAAEGIEGSRPGG